MMDKFNRCAAADCNLLSLNHALCVAHRDYENEQTFLFGQWVWIQPRPQHADKDQPRKATFLGYDKNGYAFYADGWLDVRATETENVTDLVGRCKHGYDQCRPAALCHGCCIDLIEATK